MYNKLKNLITKYIGGENLMPLKNLMREYVGDIVDSVEFEHLYGNFNIEYPQENYRVLKSEGFTHLHKCVLLTRKYTKLNDYLIEYLEYLKTCNNINACSELGYTALHLACMNSNSLSTERTVKILIACGANVDMIDSDYNTALHHASTWSRQSSSEETVRILIDAEAKINVVNSYGDTPLCIAARYAKITSTKKTVEILISRGADINYKNVYNCNVLHNISKECDYGIFFSKKIFKMLIDAGADIHLQNYKKRTPLHVFMYNCYESKEFEKIEKILSMFIDYGADVFTIRDHGSLTVYDYFDKELKKYYMINEETKTIYRITGNLTKPAIKN